MNGALPSSNPFPGMNPYLETPALWPDVHNSIIVALRDFLASRLEPEYVVRMQQRVYVSATSAGNGRRQYRIPDAAALSGPVAAPNQEMAAAEPKPGGVAVAVRMPSVELEKEHYLEVLRVGSREVIAVIELLSPTNKFGDGRQEYLAKRAEVKVSTAHLVEIDLLRAGQPMPVIGAASAGAYRILVRNARLSPLADLYVFGLTDPIPQFALPLAEGEEGVAVNLNMLLNGVYAAGVYRLDIDYGQDPEPPLSDGDRVWLDGLLRERGLRGAEAAI